MCFRCTDKVPRRCGSDDMINRKDVFPMQAEAIQHSFRYGIGRKACGVRQIKK